MNSSRTPHRSFSSQAPRALRKHKGFALVATISMMVILAVLAVALLSLSAITLKSTSMESAEAQAKANARLALMTAIGELQRQMGPDQRISANSAILSPTTVPNPNWTGVWDSWVAGERGSAPVLDVDNYPSAWGSAHQTLATDDVGPQPPVMRPNYSKKNQHFRAWLLSLSPDDVSNIYTPSGAALEGEKIPQKNDTIVELVSDGSLGAASPTTAHVSARLMNVKSESDPDITRGRFAWWVGDESQKAMIMEDSYDPAIQKTTLTMAERLFRQQASASMGNTSITGLDKINDQTQLAKLASKRSIELLTDVGAAKAQPLYHDITTSSMGVLADVREGGLKRDLNTILERKIDPDEVYNLSYVQEFQTANSRKATGDAFMLYDFDSMVECSKPKAGQGSVPIQDLAAYYQLYDGSRSGWGGGIQFSSSASSPSNSLLSDGIMVSNNDLGGGPGDYAKFLRGYTSQYRSPVPIKLEVILSYVTEKRTQAEIDADPLTLDGDPLTEADDYKLLIGLSPAMTFWNPNNVPLVMNLSDPEYSSIFMRHYPIPVLITITKKNSSGTPPVSEDIEMKKVSQTNDELFNFFYSGKNKAVFQPGETKVISLQSTSNTDAGAGATDIDFYMRGSSSEYRYSEPYVESLELVEGWQPEKFVRPANRNATARLGQVFTFKGSKKPDGSSTLGKDSISTKIDGGTDGNLVQYFTQKSRWGRVSTGAMWHYQSHGWQSRYNALAPYQSDFAYLGFPRAGRGGAIASTAARPIPIASRDGDELIKAMGDDDADLTDDLPQSFFYYSIKFGAETHESKNNALSGAGRRFPSRPFLHSSPTVSVFYDKLDAASTYNYGWNWFFMGLKNYQDAPISISTNNNGYFGGGYDAQNGTTHIVQRQLPITPPISIAALSHAILGGYSLATEAPFEGYDPGMTKQVESEALRRLTAVGHNGLGPATQQAIGNSYAHPNIPADRAFTTVERMFVEGSNATRPFVDHSYLANKALWDDYFFSSITPQPAEVKVFDGTARTAQKVAEDFFLNNKPLPNRRITPYMSGMDATKLSSLFATSTLYVGGLADKIAAHLMVKGVFNVNSTSVEAWKALFSSLKGKPVAYLDKASSLTAGVTLSEDTPDGVPVGAGGLPNAESYKGSTSSPSDAEQWVGWRELTDTEITQLATAMVKQVKLRGPFLSLSEFVNRRLDSSNPALSVKGALQAALDDTDVAINEGFRSTDRKFTTPEKNYLGAVFSEAMEGAIAYGSSAYIDQADILRNMAEQLTPRGDTFVIRAYGDSLDANGNVAARAWCEAVIQRTPEYVDPKDPSNPSDTTGDAPEVKQADLTSSANKLFGRKMQMVSFRWLNASEI